MSKDWPTPEYMIENYLTWSFAFYLHDRELASDNHYDTCCLWLKERLTSLPQWFQDLPEIAYQLSCGSGFMLKPDMLPHELKETVMSRVIFDSEWAH